MGFVTSKPGWQNTRIGGFLARRGLGGGTASTSAGIQPTLVTAPQVGG